jgi:hypothetical protein
MLPCFTGIVSIGGCDKDWNTPAASVSPRG